MKLRLSNKYQHSITPNQQYFTNTKNNNTGHKIATSQYRNRNQFTDKYISKNNKMINYNNRNQQQHSSRSISNSSNKSRDKKMGVRAGLFVSVQRKNIKSSLNNNHNNYHNHHNINNQNNNNNEVRNKYKNKYKTQYQQIIGKLQEIQGRVQEVKGNMHARFLQRTKLSVIRKQQLQKIKRKHLQNRHNNIVYQQKQKNKQYQQQQNSVMDQENRTESEKSDISSIKKSQSNNINKQVFANVQKGIINQNQKQKMTGSQSLSQYQLQDLITQQKQSYPQIFTNKNNTNDNNQQNQQRVKMQQTLNGLVTTVRQVNPGSHHSFQTNPYSPKNSNHYYISQIIKCYKDSKSVGYEHIKLSISLFNYFSTMRIPTNQEVSRRMVTMPQNQRYQGKKTIIFDLDQTLIHCNENIKMPHQIKISILFPNSQNIEAGINIRPGVREMLQQLYEDYQLVVFTASYQSYANVVINNIDPNNQYFQYRLYRQHCHLTAQGQYVKDLRIIPRHLKNMVLVDNAAYSYAFQPENGIPILPYYQGDKDFQLPMLTKYLKGLQLCQDVRVRNRQTFRLTLYRNYKKNMVQQLVQDLYINKTV